VLLLPTHITQTPGHQSGKVTFSSALRSIGLQ
jgi:hypothetical protein